MTTAAKGNQVVTAVVAALGQWLNVMHLFRFHQQALLNSTAHRTDAAAHTCHGYASKHDHSDA